jgi:hypothetical protein
MTKKRKKQNPPVSNSVPIVAFIGPLKLRLGVNPGKGNIGMTLDLRQFRAPLTPGDDILKEIKNQKKD